MTSTSTLKLQISTLSLLFFPPAPRALLPPPDPLVLIGYLWPCCVHIGGCRVDRRLRKLVPERVLALDRAAFCQWKRGRKLELTKPEATRLGQYRRQMLARVYAERARQARNEQHRGVVAELARLKRENTALHIRVAELERLVACSGGTVCR